MSPAQRIPKIAALVTFFVVVAVIFIGMYTLLAGARVPGVSQTPYRVSVLVDEPLQLIAGSDVRTSGVKVGTVDDIQPRGQRALITIGFKRNHDVVYRNARVQTRLRTLFGESFLDVDRGTPSTGRVEDGGMLAADASRETVPLDKILDTLDPATRRSVQATVRGMGRGLTGRGQDVNRIFADLGQAVDVGVPVVADLRAQRSDLATAVDQGAQVLSAVGRREAQLRSLVTSTRRAADAVSSRDAALRDSVDALPPTLKQVNKSVAAVQDLSRSATPVSDTLVTAARSLQPVLRDLPAAAADARRLVARLPAALDATDPLLRQVARFTRAAAPVADTLGPVLREVVPMLTYLEPYKRDLYGVAANMGSLFQFYKPEGADHSGPHKEINSGRVQLMASPATLGATPPALRKLEDALLRTGVLSVLGGLRTNQYPPPGTSDAPPPSDGKYSRIEALPAP
jgi:phospholipid/cholesterol/gamma-HCH transport system substrate-binding protein